VPRQIHTDNNRLILGLKIAIIFVAVLFVFGRDLAIVMGDALQNESTSYILAVPFLFAYLIYRKRKMLRAVIPLESQAPSRAIRYLATIVGVLLASTAILLYRYGSNTEYHILTLPIFAAGLTLILFNTQTLRELAFPLAFLILFTPPSEILSNVGPALSVVSSEASLGFMRFVGIPSILTSEGGDPVIQVTRSGGQAMGFAVGVASSGIYSLLGFLVFAVFIGYIIRDKPWKKLALFLIGFPLVYFLSITRIATILIIGYNFGRDRTMELFLLLGGWILIFLGTFLLLALSEKVLHTQIFSRSSRQCSECSTRPQTDRSFCFSCGKILKPALAKFHNTDLVKVGTITAALVLLTEPIAAWWEADVFLSQHSLYTAATTCALFPVVMVLLVREMKEQRRSDAVFYKKLSTGNRQVIDTIQETERITKPTLHTITASYESKTGESIAYQEMLRRLSQAERTGIIEAGVANVEDEPTQVWRSHLKPSKETNAGNNPAIK
jgi:exosortase